MANRTSRITVSATDKASKTLRKIGSNMRLLGGVAAAVGALAIGRKLVQGVTDAVRVFSEFESQMSSVRAISGATEAQMSSLTKQAKDLGRTTVFTAREAAAAQQTFAKAGFDVNEVMSALPGTLDLAAAGELGMGEAADIAAQAIRSFGLEAGNATDIADLLAKTANTANTSVTELGEGLKFVGPAAKILGVDITETNAALSILADRGLKGSLGGTALAKTMTTILGQVNKLEGATGLQGLNKQLFDSNGQFVGLAKAFEILRANGVTASDAFNIFGERAGKAAGILLDLDGELEAKTIELLDRAGYAAEVAAEKTNNLQGDTIKLKSAMEGLKIIVGEALGPALRVLVQQMTFLVTGISDATETGDGLADAFAGLARFISLFGERAISVVGALKLAWLGLRLAFAKMQEAILGGVELIIFGFRDLVSTLNVGGVLDGLIDSIDEAGREFQYLVSGASDVSAAIELELGTTAQSIDETKKKLREMREEMQLAEEERKRAAAEGEAATPAKQVEATGAAAATFEDAPLALPGANSEAEIAARKKLNDQLAESHGEYLRAKLSATQVQTEEELALELSGEENKAELARQLLQRRMSEQLALKLELMKIEQDAEMEKLGENYEAKRELEAAHEEERNLLLVDFANRRAKMEVAIEKQKAADIAAADASALQTKIGMAKAMVGIASDLFGKSKKLAIATAIINTYAAVSSALKQDPPGYPYTVAFAAAAAAQGFAQVQNIRKSKSPAFATGGIAMGPSGIDQINATVSRGELIADTNEGEARAILSGRAAVVPADQLSASRGGTTILVQGDVLDIEEFMTRHAQALGIGIERLDSDGGLI